jgi:ubiquinone/menaquinone biosynthesis C-methylase UbiE
MEYNKYAGIYDSFRFMRKSIIDFIITKINDNNYKSILDFGCGTGNFIYEITNKTNNLYMAGIDPSESMREIAHKKNPKEAIINGNHEIIPLNDNTIDMVFMVNVIHHVDDIEKMFIEFKRILKKKGGILIFTESHKQIREKTWLNYFEGAKDYDLNRFYDIPEIEKIADKTGFYCYEKNIIDEIPYSFPINEFIDLISNKAFSILHQIPGKSYENGLQKLRDDSLTKEHIIQHIAKTVLCFKKL